MGPGYVGAACCTHLRSGTVALKLFLIHYCIIV